ATLVAGGIMFAFLFLGEQLLGLFGVDISSFAVAGGIILFLIGMEMVLGRNIFKQENLHPSSASIVPIAFPLIAGAGTITTLISLRAAYELPNLVVGVSVNLAFIYVVLKSSGYIEKKLGVSGLDVMRKVFGIILLAISIMLIKDNLFLPQHFLSVRLYFQTIIFRYFVNMGQLDSLNQVAELQRTFKQPIIPEPK